MIGDNLSIANSIGVGLLTLISYKLISFYFFTLKEYPPGPLPLPLLGNILLFRKQKHLHDIIRDISKDYGNVFTLWLGPQPQVFIMDTTTVHQVLRNKALAGRPQFAFADQVKSKPGTVDIAFSDFNRAWEVNRRVSFSAVRKYAASDVLPQHVVHVTDQIVDMITKNKDNINVQSMCETTTIALLYIIAFGHKYSLEDEDIKQVIEAIMTLEDDNMVFVLGGISFIFRLFYYKKWNRLVSLNDYFRKLIKDNYEQHVATYEADTTRDIIDSLIYSKNEAEQEGEENITKYVDKWTIMNNVGDVFFAGSGTTRETLKWWFLFVALNQEMQKRIKKEIETVLPNNDDIPTQDMKEKCPFMTAFTLEVMRFKPLAPFAIPHKALEDTEVSGYRIKAGTAVMPSLFNSLYDENQWTDPGVFKPERFLENGKVISRPNACFIPFSTGSRACIGEKLALTDIFLILTRIFQRTRGMGSFQLVLKDGQTQESLVYGDISKVTSHCSAEFNLKLA